ncbi:MAG: leucine-rich repeat domain-containing protein, partial [Dinghuibacter sp.]|nr:leucine-rich repeat domain-containing protein [Dinghuibacter sp.]
NLQLLYINSNQITEIKGLDQLNNLQQIDISGNQIEQLAPLLPLLKREENRLAIVAKDSWETENGEINVAGNPLTEPRMEVVKQGNDFVIRYLEKLQTEGKENVFEAKLVLTGSGESGKTSLSLRLNNKECPLPKKDERTREVEVSDYQFKTREGNDFTAHIWDFGGQQIIHNFHRLFMNDSALYILLTETSRENDDFDYWLQTIQLFGGNSPILFVQNKRNGIPRSLGITHYKNHFNIKDDLYEVNLLNNQGLDTLEQAIQRHIQELPIVQRTIPRSWFNLRKKLEQVKEPYINYNRFVEECQACKITERIDIEDAGLFLHLLGVILWYKDNPALRDKIVLERHWATKALFQLVFHEQKNQQQKGYFSIADAQAIWDADAETDYKHHTAQLVSLMQEFKLAYKRRNKKDCFIIPALLPPTQPAKGFSGHNPVKIVYEYKHLPRGMVNQLTAELYERIENDENTWSEGVWLKEGNTEARVMENRNNRTITVEICGVQHRELFGAIKTTLDIIHSEYKGIQYEMKIPCICPLCKTNAAPHLYNYQTIIKRIEEGKKETIECVKSTDDVLLYALLNNILPPQTVTGIGQLGKEILGHISLLHKANDKTHHELAAIKVSQGETNKQILQLLTLSQQSQNDLQQLLEKVDAGFSEEKANTTLKQIENAI